GAESERSRLATHTGGIAVEVSTGEARERRRIEDVDEDGLRDGSVVDGIRWGEGYAQGLATARAEHRAGGRCIDEGASRTGGGIQLRGAQSGPVVDVGRRVPGDHRRG